MHFRHLRVSFVALLCFVTPLGAAPARPAPALPPASGAIVRVSTEGQLRDAVSNLRSNTTIEIAPGVYSLSDALYVKTTCFGIFARLRVSLPARRC